MPILRVLSIIVVMSCLAFGGRAQQTSWKSLKLNKVSVNYPPSWHLTRETRGAQVRVTLTPDSMQQLTMRMFEIMELPLDGEHNYAYFKKEFPTILKPWVDQGGKILKSEEITFKNHTSMYAEIIASSLPTKVYGVDAGDYIYVIVLTRRRYSKIADPGLERDGMGILNSISFGQ